MTRSVSGADAPEVPRDRSFLGRLQGGVRQGRVPPPQRLPAGREHDAEERGGVFRRQALRAFRRTRQAHPEARALFVSTEQTLDLVGQGRVDLGIVYGATGSTDTRTDDLGLSEVACELNKAHALTAKMRTGPSDLVGESVATYRPDTPLGRELERTIRAAGGFGVALIDPFILAGGPFHNLAVRAFGPTTGARVQIITPKDEPLSRVC